MVHAGILAAYKLNAGNGNFRGEKQNRPKIMGL